jgi:hypothetical protein
MSFTWTYDNRSQAALSCIQQARRLIKENVSPQVRSWLAAVEAEIWANLGDLDACLKAFNVAEYIEDKQSSEDSYWIHFDRSLLAGYKGVCFRRLYRPEDRRTHPFLDDAQKALLNALTGLDSTLILRKPTYHIDLASTYIPQEEIGQACEHAHQAVTIIARIKSQTTLQRLLVLRQDLEKWKDTLEVEALDEHMAPLLLSRG